MADKDIELVSVVGQGGLLVQAGHEEAVGITANASEGRWTFGGTVWLTADEADRLAHALRHMADRAREKLAKERTGAEANWAEKAVKRAVDGVGGFTAEMREKGIHVGLGLGGSPGRCVTCAEPWPCSHMGMAEMDAAEAMNRIGRAVEEAMGDPVNSEVGAPPRGRWLPLSVRYAAAEAAAKVVVEWRAGNER